MKEIPLIILHGWDLNSDRFSPLVKALRQKNYLVFCPNLPGFGKMPKPMKSLYLKDYIQFVLKFMADNKFKKAIFICHSFGGRIGIKLAALYPNKIHKLILTGAPGLLPVPQVKVIFFHYLAKIGKLVFSLPGLNLLQNLAQKVIYRMAGASDYYNTDQRMRETFQNVVKENISQYLPLINAETLLLWGKNDSFVAPGIAIKMSKIISKNKLSIIDNIGHGFPYTNPKMFVNHLEEFL